MFCNHFHWIGVEMSDIDSNICSIAWLVVSRENSKTRYVRRGDGQEGEARTGENSRGVGVRRVDKTYMKRGSK